MGRAAVGRRKYPPFEERFWANVDKSGECWLWTAATTREGYGTIRFNGVTTCAHRIAYELLVGPIPQGLELDHLCRTPACVNPAHLEPVTHRENMLRGRGVAAAHASQTHCLRGHPFDEENTLRLQGKRVCRACVQIRRRNRSARDREARLLLRRQLNVGGRPDA